jgi:hypothetical protein
MMNGIIHYTSKRIVTSIWSIFILQNINIQVYNCPVTTSNLFRYSHKLKCGEFLYFPNKEVINLINDFFKNAITL